MGSRAKVMEDGGLMIKVALGAVGLLLAAVSLAQPAGQHDKAPQGPVARADRASAAAAGLATPAGGQVLSNVYQGGTTEVSVTGTTSGMDLNRWSVDCGAGADPSAWATIATGRAPVTSASLGTWHTESLPNGTYTLRLQVWDEEGNRSAVTTLIQLANFTMTQNALELNAGAGGRVTYTSTVPFPLTETLVLRNRQGYVVRTLVSERRSAGSYADVWDGRDDAGGYVPDGPYFYVATVSDGAHSMTWDLSNQYLSNYFDSKDSLHIAAFDPFNNRPLTLTYNSPVGGLVTISVFSTRLTSNECNQPPDKALCLVNRKYEEAGSHTFVWAGVDQAGVYQASLYSLMSITTIRDRFAKNAVVVFGTKPTIRNVTIVPSAFSPGLATPVVSFDLGTFHDQPTDVTVTFLNQASLSTLRTIRLPAQSPGHISLPWDVRADNGSFVAPGWYTITVTARDAIGNEVQGQILATVRR